MKKLLFTLVALALGLTAMAQPATHVRVTPASGDAVLLSFDSSPEITMLADGVKVASVDLNSPLSFQFDEIESIDFVSETEVASVAGDDLKVVVLSDRVEFAGIPQNSLLRVFSLEGHLLYSQNASGNAVLYKADFPSGIYVVAVGNNSFKLIF